jgi:hypothetical protein
MSWSISNEAIGAHGDAAMLKAQPLLVGTGKRTDEAYEALAAGFNAKVQKALHACPARKKADHLAATAADATAKAQAIADELAAAQAAFDDAIADGKTDEALVAQVEVAAVRSRLAVAQARADFLARQVADAVAERDAARSKIISAAAAELTATICAERMKAVAALAEAAGKQVERIEQIDRLMAALRGVDADAGKGLSGQRIAA